MTVFHVCTAKKLAKYKETGYIMPPVRAWENIKQALRMHKRTSRSVILCLKFPDNAEKLEGHFNQARVLHYKYSVKNL